MINLIPNEEKKINHKDFYFRLATLVFFMLGISFLGASILILPSYYVSYLETNILMNKLDTQEEETGLMSDQNVLETIKDIKNKLTSLENAQNNKFVFSQKIINQIILKKIPKIKITEIIYQNDLTLNKKINIRGIASSREVLLLFRKALEDSPAFLKVDLPISNFVKGSDIKFYLSLIPS